MTLQLSLVSLAAVFMSLSLSSCAHKAKFETRTAGPKFEYKSYKDKIFLSPQPTAKNLKHLKEKEGVEVVINLRSPKEIAKLGYNPRTQAKKLGLKYYNLPFLVNGKPNKAAIAKIESTFMKDHKAGKKILVHCSSGNRAGGWLATHFAAAHKVSTAKALEYGRKGGLKSSELQAKMIPFLKDNY